MSRMTLLLLTYLALAVPAWAAEPASITAIDVRTGVVTAMDAGKARKIQFKVTDAALLKRLKIGQKVQADLGTQKVSVDGAAPCCAIVAMQTVPPIAGASGMSAVASEARAAESGRAAALPGTGRKPDRRDLKRTVSNSNETEERACKDAGGEWRCTTVATGSSPGPEDDVVHCTCIYSGKP
jgi:hypothetical protein